MSAFPFIFPINSNLIQIRVHSIGLFENYESQGKFLITVHYLGICVNKKKAFSYASGAAASWLSAKICMARSKIVVSSSTTKPPSGPGSI